MLLTAILITIKSMTVIGLAYSQHSNLQAKLILDQVYYTLSHSSIITSQLVSLHFVHLTIHANRQAPTTIMHFATMDNTKMICTVYVKLSRKTMSSKQLVCHNFHLFGRCIVTKLAAQCKEGAEKMLLLNFMVRTYLPPVATCMKNLDSKFFVRGTTKFYCSGSEVFTT